MDNIGWEMRPAGWIVLFVLTVVLAYFINQWWQHRSGNNPRRT